jgi:DNA excision repair protein ERCC-6
METCDDVAHRNQGSDKVLPPTTLDDFEEDDYEDRVDEWIAHGIDRMRVMKERDETEQPPGEEVYDGGLTIPAWVNDNLFPYQRTGLQWMWELHRQQAGGIIGGTCGFVDVSVRLEMASVLTMYILWIRVPITGR